MLGEKIGGISGKNYCAARLIESRRRPKNGNLVSGEWLNTGRRHQGYGNVFDALSVLTERSMAKDKA